MPEFFDIEVTRQVFSLIEEIGALEEIFDFGSSESPVRVVYGPELGNKNLEPVGFVYMCFPLRGQQCHMGLIGSHRFDYRYIVPMMKYFKSLVQEVAGEVVE
jgi:transcriptional regulator of heat shock response